MGHMSALMVLHCSCAALRKNDILRASCRAVAQSSIICSSSVRRAPLLAQPLALTVERQSCAPGMLASQRQWGAVPRGWPTQVETAA
jgi:hypothetical protein